jgi:large subunit ribosomal protein L35
MPKMKSNKSVKKRFKVTGSGKVMRNKCGKRHLNSGKTGKRKRQLRGHAIVETSNAAKYVLAMLGGK